MPWYTFKVYTAAPQYTAAPLTIMAQLERFYATPKSLHILLLSNQAVFQCIKEKD